MLEAARSRGERRGASAIRALCIAVSGALLGIGLPQQASAQVQVVRGEIVESVEVTTLHSLRVTQYFDFQGNPVDTVEFLDDGTSTTTQMGTDRCVHVQRMYGSPDDPTPQEFTNCSTVSLGEVQLFMSVFVGSRGYTSYRLPADTVQEISTTALSGSSSYSLTAEFPAPPPGTQITAVRIRTLSNTSLSRPSDWMFPGATLEQTGPPVYDPFEGWNCPTGLLSTNLQWVFPPEALDENRRLQVSFDVETSCPNDTSTVGEGPTVRNELWNDYVYGGLLGQLLVEAVVEPVQRFDVKFGTFIPADSVPGPPQSFCSRGEPGIVYALRYDGDHRVAPDPDPGASVRGAHLISVVADASVETVDAHSVDPDGIISGSVKALPGVSKSFAPPAYEDGVIDEDDEDAVLDDCYLLHQKKRADASGMSATSERLDDDTVEVKIEGALSNPIVPIYACTIDYDFDLTLAKSGEWMLQGQHNAFPAYELFANETLLHAFSPGEAPFSMSAVFRLCNHFLNETVDAAGTLPP